MATDVARHLTMEELEAGLDEIRRAPAADGTVALIVRRPVEGEREVLAEGVLDLDEGLVGDRWGAHRSSKTPDGSPNRETQVTLMSVRVVDLVAAGDRERWALAGDQLYVDLDISEANLPAGARLSLGSAVIEVTPEPHTGCVKFMSRFGKDAHRFVNTKPYRHLRLRGLNAKVVEPGTVAAGDTIRKL
jgi:MOSC domain-containing protein YiiM